ncbi:ABC transporter ATP-binding protein [Macrococcus hajekii]|uniref:ABC transporter ATP-binding protein n=1 Tax=Macrococcus hajekii TaxID=198482 RepID=A0A4R6BJZ2_9STAP|nr:ABC transporter ATP-binding protein [Macrococcus hajekii]TDM02042.1 ABC transporter ATP-binding protein [Macrococcus hajekii]GGB09589.1 putative ABC transporter ATP-binding protein YhaQ [Macrococcus hajekii]
MLNIQNVTKKFGHFKAVDDLTFEVPAGEMLGFLGGNGAGKTTTFRMILGLLERDTGVISYKGQPINYQVTDRIGYLPEERGLNPKLKVSEQLTYLASLKGMKKRDISREIDYWLERFEVTENKEKKIEALSKGNQQKIQLIGAIIHQPELLILDEPFSGLDPVNVELLKSAVKEINDSGATIVFSSHRMEHVEEMCDRVCILDRGLTVVEGNIQQVKQDFGRKEIIIRGDHDFSHLQEIPHVIAYKENRQDVKLTIDDMEAAPRVFEAVSRLGYVSRFEVAEPSLNDIFLAKVGRHHE